MRISTFQLRHYAITGSLLMVGISQVQAQDTTRVTTLELIETTVTSSRPTPERLQDVDNTYLFAGKKNEVIRLSSIQANLVTNNARQVFSRIPGMSVWENDGSGTQISVATRGLSPNRSWEFNTRQNGYDISSDVFGYPEAYYNPPLEAVEKVQIVRGAASLQFGAQFGGLLNYILKRENTNTPFSFETQNTVGSYGLLSSYNAIGGNTDKWNYYVYNHSRKGNGWRENGHYEVRNTHAFLQYKFNSKGSISAEYTNMDYVVQQSGGLTDEQFAADARQSLRQRNWMGIPWQVANINAEYRPNDKLLFNLKVFGLWGDRSSVGFTARPNLADTINAVTNDYNNRQVDIDHYRNLGTEFRGVWTYKLGNQHSNLAFGARAYQANMQRLQRGTGNTGMDYNTSISTDKFPTDYRFKTKNIAVFLENTFNLTQNFSLTPGIRYEHLVSSIEGRANITGGNEINVTPQTITRNVILAGLGAQYKLGRTNVYANVSQAYRPVLFSDLVPPATTDIIDPNLKDANGFNADLGYRGNLFSHINFDVSAFYLNYNNRIGTVRRFVNNDPSQSTYQYRTNLGQSVNMGVEAYIEFSISKPLLELTRAFTRDWNIGNLNAFASLAFVNAEYVDFKTTSITGSAPNIVITETNLKGNKVENAPSQIHNFGLTYNYKGFTASAQTRITSKVFSDATNTLAPSTDGTVGEIAGYSVYDLSLEYKFLEKYNIKAGINNLTDTKYATRRAGGFPGPGLISGEGRTFYISFGAKFTTAPKNYKFIDVIVVEKQ